MASVPIKNGVNVRLVEYSGKFVRADIYKIGNAYIFVGTTFYSFPDTPIDVDVIMKGNTIERSSGMYDVYIVPEGNCTFHNKDIMNHEGEQRVDKS